MGQEIGNNALTKKICQSGIIVVVLAFFTVVASSPNLSTFLFWSGKVSTKNVLYQKNVIFF